ncbi:hypothetical protein [Microvirga sp. KLBC 81]|uniref:hypothetical protein n=1 Tax=Microvirga sp. KLBC 81 TaxID=1862707 RepID=UPI00197BC9DB|nr:hypothetical protein [Microvirga sp. KLBC 81]
MTFERENVQRLAGYIPGEQPRRAVAKLNTNENPFPPCDAVLAALAGIDGEMLRRYPDPTAWGSALRPPTCTALRRTTSSPRTAATSSCGWR